MKFASPLAFIILSFVYMTRFRHMEILFHIFYYYWGEAGGEGNSYYCFPPKFLDPLSPPV